MSDLSCVWRKVLFRNVYIVCYVYVLVMNMKSDAVSDV